MENKVKIYSLSTCSHCKSAKKFLDKCSVQYEFTDVDLLDGDERKAVVEEVRRLNEMCTFPTIIINDQVLIGFNEEKLKKALGI